jgi:DMSO/TMAO reductase YedYZ heme-binding membrane subunit
MTILLLALMILLGVTSLTRIRRRVSSRLWKRVQWLAYPFILLIYAHVLSYLLPSALGGGGQALQSVAFYTAAILVYVILRLRLWVVSSKYVSKI